MIEIVCRDDWTKSSIQGSLDIASEVLSSVLPEELVRYRLIDGNELDNLENSRLANGSTDLREYIIRQKADRITHNIPDSHKIISIVSGRTCTIESSRVIEDPYGYSIGEYNEGAVSISSIASRTPQKLHRFLAPLYAYTIIHETGHLFNGLVAPESRRQTLGRHCGNVCVMRSTATTKDTLDLIADGMGGRICFCSECAYDLNKHH
jgi:hypothetical protein